MSTSETRWKGPSRIVYRIQKLDESEALELIVAKQDSDYIPICPVKVIQKLSQ